MKSFFVKYHWFLTLGFLAVSNLFIWNFVWSSDSSLRVYFLDVGQGDAILIKSPSGNKMLIDAGQGGAVLDSLSKSLPFHDRKIEVLLVTHSDADHIGGFIPILERFETDLIIESGVAHPTRIVDNFNYLAEESPAKRIVAERGMFVDLGGGAVFVVLFPDRDVSGLNPNDASIVGKLFFGENSFMLTGDAPIKIEEYLVFLDGEILKSDVLKVGHHGSKTSTSDSFVKAVRPDIAVIQAGRDNKYGHPHKEVLETLQNNGVKTLGNYDLGTILFRSDGRTIKVRGL